MKVNLNPMQTSNSTLITAKKTAGVSIAICVFVSLLVGAIGFAVGTRYQNFFASNREFDLSEMSEVYSALNARFDGKLDKNKLMQGAASGMASATGDPFTSYLTAEDAKTLNSDLSGTFEGIGAELGQNSDKQLEIVSVIDGSPAKKAGLQSHDIIVLINDEKSVDWTPEKAVNIIRGKAGTTVKLTINRAGEKKEYSLTRAKITNPSVVWEISDDNGATWIENSSEEFKAKLESDGKKIGYIRISRFGDDTARLTANAARQMKNANVNGIVLDLRGNGGGYVNAAQGVANLWLKSGDIIVEEKTGDVIRDKVKANGNPILLDVPTTVLIDGGSASASEIVAGALRDNDAAVLIGTQSYGKGSVQELVNLRSGSMLKITIARWYTPKGVNINGDGLKPDIEVEMTADEYNSGNDKQRNKAIEKLNQ